MSTENKEIKNFGEWFKDLRDREGISQAQMADLIGFNNSQSIAMIETNKKLLPIDKWAPFCKLFRLNLKAFCYQMYLTTIKFKEKEPTINEVL